jgi:hypothetical protein
MSKPKYVAIFHANLNYAFLTPDKYERTIRASYEAIFDSFAKFPDQRYVFEASGYTIDVMAKLTPDVLKKLRKAIDNGQCEFMGAPYAHPIMANVPEEDGYWSCEFAQRTYEKRLGIRPESWWNPECTWMQYVPRAFARAGAKYLTLDFESYMNSNDPQYSWVERNRTRDIYWGGHLPAYELDPNCKFLHQPFRDVVPGVSGMCRSDRIVGRYISYFLGKATLEDYLDNVKKWTGDGKKGATIIIADDAEYCGTTGYYYVKYYRDYDKCFVVDPEARAKLEALIAGIRSFGQLVTFKEACDLEPVAEPFFVEEGYAWHRTYSEVWAGTPEAKNWDPILAALRRAYKTRLQPITEGTHAKEFEKMVADFWFHITCSANSDGRWPAPPAKTCPFNRQWVLDEVKATRAVMAKMRERIKAKGYKVPRPEKYVEDADAESSYNFHFTDKPMRDEKDIPHLNTYELSHAIYYYNSMVDSQVDAKIAKGKRMLKAVFDELDRRQMKGIRHWAAR